MIPKWIARFRAKMQYQTRSHRQFKYSMDTYYDDDDKEFEKLNPTIDPRLLQSKLNPQRISIFDIINWKRVAAHMLWIAVLAVFLVQVLITITKPQQEPHILTVIDYNSIGEINKHYQILEDNMEVQKQILNDPDLANYKKEIINTKDGKILRLEQI